MGVKSINNSNTNNQGSCIKWKLIAYPVIAVTAVISFVFIFFNVMPVINNIGLVAFSSSEDVLFNYYVLPFTCIDMSIALLYYKLFKKFAIGLCNYLKDKQTGKDAGKNEKEC